MTGKGRANTVSHVNSPQSWIDAEGKLLLFQ